VSRKAWERVIYRRFVRKFVRTITRVESRVPSKSLGGRPGDSGAAASVQIRRATRPAMSSFSGRLSHPKPEGRRTSSPARSNGHGGIVSQRANRAYARFARVRLTRWSATMRISACGAFRQWLNKLGLDVPGKWSTRHNRRPKFQRRGLDQTTVERHHVQVVVQKGAAPTVTSVTGQPYSGSTLTPMADTADVRARRIGEEDIGALVPTLGSALESPTSSRERGKVGIVFYRDQHVGIFRIMLVSDQ
jgi:hypothetical protein